MTKRIATALLLVSLSYGAELPNAPSATHHFVDRRNAIAYGIGASLLAVDAVQTQRFLQNRYREANPLARPLVTRGWPGQMTASALGFSGALALGYMFHKTNHHKLERLVPELLIGVETAVVIHNAR